MSYATNLAAKQQETTPEFYKITIGATTYRYTTYGSDQTFLANTYTSTTIKRSGFSYDDDFGVVQVTLTAALNDLFRTYIANQPSEPVTVTIYRAIKSDLTDYVTLFNGQVKNVAIKKQQVTATCVARSIYLEKRIPCIIQQSYCNHDVFDSGCTLSGLSWLVAGTITDVTASTLTAAAWTAYDDDYFMGGMAVTAAGDARLITGSTKATGVIDLQIPFDSRVGAGVVVDAYPGCDGNPATCINKFNNLTNLLAMPYIPSRNPVLYGFK